MRGEYKVRKEGKQMGHNSQEACPNPPQKKKERKKEEIEW